MEMNMLYIHAQLAGLLADQGLDPKQNPYT